jgi:BirA family biotin operon repressor/biotin-[acetyl-CoA-carboxylase] ligase
LNITVLQFDSLDSTNTTAIEQAKQGAAEGLCVVSRRQSAGRGRQGRRWISEKDAGLYFSIVLRPRIELKFLPLITLMTAVAVHDLLETEYGLKPDIKWSNDVQVRGKKICGILAETVETERDLAVVVGIGLNLYSADLPDDISETATSIREETGHRPNLEELLTGLTSFVTFFYDILCENEGAKQIRFEWSKRSTFSDGKLIRAISQDESIIGTTCGLEENGALRLKSKNGEIRVIQAGDVVSIRENSEYNP